MSSIRDAFPDFQQDTLAYLHRLDVQSAQSIALAEKLPIPPTCRAELCSTWSGTRQRLAYFQDELRRADGEFRLALERLHRELLPDVISYQVRQGAQLMSQNGAGDRFVQRWRTIWLRELNG